MLFLCLNRQIKHLRKLGVIKCLFVLFFIISIIGTPLFNLEVYATQHFVASPEEEIIEVASDTATSVSLDERPGEAAEKSEVTSSTEEQSEENEVRDENRYNVVAIIVTLVAVVVGASISYVGTYFTSKQQLTLSREERADSIIREGVENKKRVYYDYLHTVFSMSRKRIAMTGVETDDIGLVEELYRVLPLIDLYGNNEIRIKASQINNLFFAFEFQQNEFNQLYKEISELMRNELVNTSQPTSVYNQKSKRV